MGSPNLKSVQETILRYPFAFILLLLTILFVIYVYISRSLREHYCDRIPKENDFGAQNDKNIDLVYGPQDNVLTSNCQKYWKEFPNEQNTDFLEDIPLDRNMAYQILPFTAKAGNTAYNMGLIDYNRLIPLINDPGLPADLENPLSEEYSESLVSPTGSDKPVQYDFELKYDLYALNKKTWIHRAKEFDPTKKNSLPYDKIKSPIEDVNTLNQLFIKRVNEKQRETLTNVELIAYGLTKFDIYKYAIQSIKYHRGNPKKKIYTIKVVIFRENDVFTPTIFYRGFVDQEKGEFKIMNAEYIGSNESSNYLMNESAGLRKSAEKYQMLNDNYRHDDPDYYRDVDKELAARKDYMKQFDLKESYACFNTDPEKYINPGVKTNIMLPYISRQQCEAPYDWFSRPKSRGVFDKPCQKDTDCPFFRANSNYTNSRGGCQKDGKCELPIGMIPMGYHYYVEHPDYKPRCYNCDSSEWGPNSKLGTCCDKQAEGLGDGNKYSFLKSADYAFHTDITERQNFENAKTKVFINKKV